MSTKKFQYRPREAATTHKRSEQWGNERDSYLKDHVPMWKPNDGENVIRILPPSWDDADHFGYDIYVHYGVGPDNSTYLDLAKMKRGPDPIQEEAQKAKMEGDEEYFKQLDSKKRVLVYLIDRDKPKEGPMLWAMPWSVDKDIAKQCWDSRTQEALPIDSPDDGYDVIIIKEGTKERTRYTVKIARRPSPLEITDQIADVLEQYPLPECLNFFSYEYIKNAFTGTVKAKSSTTTNGGDDEPAKAPVAKSRKKAVELSELTWEDIHAMKGVTLDELVARLDHEMNIRLDPEKETDEELADAICEALEISAPKRTTPRRHNRTEEAATKPRAAVSKNDESEPDDVPFETDEPEDEPEPPKPASKAGSYKERLAGIRGK